MMGQQVPGKARFDFQHSVETGKIAAISHQSR